MNTDAPTFSGANGEIRVAIESHDRELCAILTEGLRQKGIAVAVQNTIDDPADSAISVVDEPPSHEKVKRHSIILMARGSRTTMTNFINEGAIACLYKPVSLDELVLSIRIAEHHKQFAQFLMQQLGHLQTSAEGGNEISLAIGVVAASDHLRVEEARSRLRAYARSQRCKLSELSKEILNAFDTQHRILDSVRKIKP